MTKTRVHITAVAYLVASSLSAEIRYEGGGTHVIEGLLAEGVVVAGQTELTYAAELSRESVGALLPPDEAERLLETTWFAGIDVEDGA